MLFYLLGFNCSTLICVYTIFTNSVSNNRIQDNTTGRTAMIMSRGTESTSDQLAQGTLLYAGMGRKKILDTVPATIGTTMDTILTFPCTKPMIVILVSAVLGITGASYLFGHVFTNSSRQHVHFTLAQSININTGNSDLEHKVDGMVPVN